MFTIGHLEILVALLLWICLWVFHQYEPIDWSWDVASFDFYSACFFYLPLFSVFLSLLYFGKIKMGRPCARGGSMGDANEKNRKWDDDDLIIGVLLEGKSWTKFESEKETRIWIGGCWGGATSEKGNEKCWVTFTRWAMKSWVIERIWEMDSKKRWL